MGIKLEYLMQPANRWTFKQPKLKTYIESWCKGNILNLFAGKTKLNVNEFRVDLSNEFKPDHLGNAFDFINETKLKFDTIILDPPYSIRKSREKYNGKYIGKLTKIKNEIVSRNILNSNGIIISLGYSSVGMSKSRGFKKIGICLVCHSGDHNDTIVVIEEKIQTIIEKNIIKKNTKKIENKVQNYWNKKYKR